jgi:ABC-2 type transport system permease protein
MRLSRIYAVTYRNIVNSQKNFFRLFDITLWPLVLFLSLTLFIQYIKGESAILGAVILGVMGWRIVYHMQIEFCQSYMDNWWSGMLGHFMISPVTTLEFILGNLVVAVVKMGAVAGTYFIFAKLLFDYTFTNWNLILIGSLILMLFGLCMGLITLGICMIYQDNAFAVAYLLPDLIVLFSGVYYPVTIFPVFIQKVMTVFPTLYAFEILKASVGLGSINIPYSIATVVLWFVISVSFLIFCKKYAKRKGLFAKLN